MAEATVVWEHMDAAARAAYEREHGTKPPGYRGTGRVDWFAAWHPDTAPCAGCAVITDRWSMGGAVFVGLVRGTAHVNQSVAEAAEGKARVLCCEVALPWCWSCERRAAIVVLERRQQNPELGAAVKASEAVYLAELVAEREADIPITEVTRCQA